MNDQPSLPSLLGKLLKYLADMVKELLAVLRLKLGSNSMSSVSWNG